MSFIASHRARALVMGAAFGIALAGCGGRSIPTHDGYRASDTPGWKKPKALSFDEENESEADGEISYAKRKRSRWYQIELPADGEISVSISANPIGTRAALGDDAEDLDVAFEVLDKNYRMLVRADKEEEDAGELKKTRTVYELRKDRYYIHVWAQSRIDEAEFTLRLKFKSVTIAAETDFPAQVAFIDPLAVVPGFDDAPPPSETKPPPKPRCRGERCGRAPKPPPKGDDGADTPTPTGVITGRIIGVRAAGNGTTIIIDRGAAAGIQSGWRGAVINAAGKAIPQGDFTIGTVKPTESYATVGASTDAVSAAKRVRIIPK